MEENTVQAPVEYEVVDKELEARKQDPAILQALRVRFLKQNATSTFDKERIEMLMKRRSSRKWDAAKTARMVRRLMTAQERQEQALNALEHIDAELTKLTATLTT